jgi:WD40 repeat protein
VSSLAFSPDGWQLASGSWSADITVWDLAASPPQTQKYEGHRSNVFTVDFSPDGKLLATGGADSSVRVWELGGIRTASRMFERHKGTVYSVVFSPDGRVLASGGGDTGPGRDDSSIVLWDMAIGQMIASPLRGHTGRVLSMAFRPDGKLLASAGGDGAVLLWDVDPDSWVNSISRLANRNLSLPEWEEFVGRDEPYQASFANLPLGEGTTEQMMQAHGSATVGALLLIAGWAGLWLLVVPWLTLWRRFGWFFVVGLLLLSGLVAAAWQLAVPAAGFPWIEHLAGGLRGGLIAVALAAIGAGCGWLQTHLDLPVVWRLANSVHSVVLTCFGRGRISQSRLKQSI